MSNKISSAEEYVATWARGIYTTEEIMKGFAQLHVKAALEAAAEDIGVDRYAEPEENVRDIKKSILNAYPLTNIK